MSAFFTGTVIVIFSEGDPNLGRVEPFADEILGTICAACAERQHALQHGPALQVPFGADQFQLAPGGWRVVTLTRL